MQVYHKAGYPGFVARLQERGPEYLKAVNWMSYQLAPRAQIFRRDSSNVTDFESLKSVMRYNSWKDDPVCSSLLCCISQTPDGADHALGPNLVTFTRPWVMAAQGRVLPSSFP